MSIINSFDDINMVISDFSEEDVRRFVSGREFAVIIINADVFKNDIRSRFGLKFSPMGYLGVHFDTYTLQIDNGDNSGDRTYLFIKDKLPKFKQVEGVNILYPSVDELLPMVLGKRLVYYNKFAEDNCDVEDTVNRHLHDDVFNIINKDEYYLYHSFFRVQVFLQKVSGGDTEEQTMMTPSDIRDYNINNKILSTLKEWSNSFYNDAITMQYNMESNKLQAQYFLSKFHSNREWDIDPVCILNFRIASFILPGTFYAEKAAELPKEKIAYDITNGTKYVIDSIHIDSDICSDLSDLDKWMETFTYNISLA